MDLIIQMAVQWAAVTAVFIGIGLAAPGIKVESKPTLVVAGVAFGGANVLLGWLLVLLLKILLFLPYLLTLGLIGVVFPVIVNAFLLKTVDLKFEDKLHFDGMQPLLATAIAVSLTAFAVRLIL